MAYCTVTDLADRFTEDELRDVTGLADGEDLSAVPVLLAAIDDASAEIDGFLGGRYRVPIARRVPVLVWLATTIARYRYLKDREHAEALRRYQDAVKMLERIASGEVSLGGEIGSSSLGILFDAREPAFDSTAQEEFLGGLK